MDQKVPSTLIKNVRLFTDGELHDDSALAIADGLISAIFLSSEQEKLRDFEASFSGEVIDGNGAMLLPGVIDAHVHFREPGMTRKADIASESLAAAAGGVTYVMDMPNTDPTTTTLEALRQKAALFKEKCIVNYGLFFGITQDNIDQALAIPQDEICGYKVFLGSSTGGMLMNDATLLRKLFSSTKRVIAVHSEDEDIISENRSHFSGYMPVEYHPFIRSREACVKTTTMAINLAMETGANLHICHISTADELELIKKVNADRATLSEKNITAEACIGHLWFCDKDYARYGSLIKCNPAIKTRQDRDALRSALCTGVIDTIATDHAPHLLKDKSGGALDAASGMPSVQFSLLAMLNLVEKQCVPLAQVIKLMCENPAERFGLANRGKIAVGYAADLVMVADGRSKVIYNNISYKKTKGIIRYEHIKVLSKCRWSPFQGQIFHHFVKATWVNGKRVF